MVLNVGGSAIDRTSSDDLANTTAIFKDNPANATGTITSVEIWANTSLSGCIVGTFYSTGTNQFSSRSSATIGTVSSGVKQTFSGLSINCVAGDFIGLYVTTGKMESDGTGSGEWLKTGNNIPCTNVTFVLYSGYIDSLHAIGTAPDTGNPLFFGMNF
jgi:hypothetical protein